MTDETGNTGQGTGVAEEGRHQSEEMFRLLVQSVLEYAIFLLDPTGRILNWNAGAQRLKGYTAQEIIGQHFSRFYPPEVPRDFIQQELEIAIRDGQFRDEGWRVRKDGSRFWADVTITPVRDTSGTLRGFAKVTRDMTARKLAEQHQAHLMREQGARLEAERANRMKDEFLATLSHELRTPLNAIVGWAHLLETKELDAETRKAVDVIRRNAAAQTQLISDILDISRISAGKVHLRVQRVDLEKVILAAIDAMSPAAGAKAIHLTRVLSSDAGEVSGDPDRLQQVVWNLLSNAVKFTPKGGRIHIRLHRVDSHVEIAVEDTGMGIASEFLPHLFEPFRQADSTPTRSHGGLGLGLSIVRHLTELHGGRVWASSRGLGQGSLFTIELPTLSVAAPDAAGFGGLPGTVAPNLYGLHILVVEDDEDARVLLAATLERFGAEVAAVASADEALAQLRERRPDVLVSDIEMPERSGYQLIEAVRALPAEQGGLVPAIAVTAFARPEDRIRALASGFQMHVAKPVLPAELGAAVAAVTARSRP